jgi:predicted ester cyclase
MATADEKLMLMQTADDAWNARDFETFRRRHSADVLVRIAGSPETRGIDTHVKVAGDYLATFPDLHVHNRPYQVTFGTGDWTLAYGRITGTMTGPMTGPDGKQIPPNGKSFDIAMCTIARWEGEEMAEEIVVMDTAAMMSQLELSQ